MKFVRTAEPKMGVLKIIPHHSVLNSSSRKFQQSIFELFSVPNPKYPWQHKDGLYIASKPNPRLWWIIKMSAEEIEKKIEFFVAMPEEFIESFKIKLNNHEQWRRSTIEEVPEGEFEFPEHDENTELYKLKYTRHDMFSMKFDYTQQTTPTRDLLSVSNELKAGESVDFFMSTEPTNRNKWKKLADYAWGQWEKGGVPYRKGIDPTRLFYNFAQLINFIFLEIRDLLQDTISAIESAFFHKNQSGERQRAQQEKAINPERAALLVNGDLSNQTKKKRNLPVFKTNIRYVIKAQDPIRRSILSKSVDNAFEELSGDNKLKSVKVNINARRELDELKKWLIKDWDENLMSTEELGKIQQLPTRELQEEFKEHLQSNQKIEIDIPKQFLDGSGIYMGTSEVKGQNHNIYWSTADKDMLFTPRALIGSPRMGKDMAAVNMIVEANRRHGIGAIIPDVIDERKGHRGMADALRDHLPAENIIDINLGDFDWPVYIGLNGLSKGKDERIVSNRIAQELTNFLMGDDIENHQTREYLREFAKAANGDLIDIKLMCTSDKFREGKIKELKVKNRDTLVLENFHSMSEARKSQIANPIIVRLGELLGDEFLKPIFGQRPNPEVSFEKWIKQGKVVIIRIPNRDLGEIAVKMIVYWIVLVTFLTRLSMSGEDKGLFLVLNEPHQFLSKGLIHFSKRLLAEGPKYQMTPIFLFHNFAQLPNDFVQILLSASLNWHIFKNTNDEVYKRLDPYISPTFTPETAMAATKRYHFIASWLDASGEYQQPFMMQAPNLVNERYETLDNSFLTKRHSRRYGRNIDVVLKDIQERQRIIYQTA